MSKTSFARWRSEIGWTQEASARRLDVTLRTIQYWEAGKTSAGDEIAPPGGMRLAMAALIKNPKLEAWPE